MGKQRRRTAQVLTTIEQRRLKLEEEIRNLESQPDSPSRNRSLATKRRLLVNVDKERYNWLGLEDEEELGTEHFLKNIHAVISQRKAGLATAIKGAIGMKILGTDPLISNVWAGSLMLRDMFRGRKAEEDVTPKGTKTPPPTIPSMAALSPDGPSLLTLPTGDNNSSATVSLLSQIANISEQTFNLLKWVYTYRRARFREIMNLDNIKNAALATTATNTEALPPGEFRESLTDRENDVENKVTDLIALTREGLFGSPKLLGPAGPIAGLLTESLQNTTSLMETGLKMGKETHDNLGKIHEATLIQASAIEDLEPTEEESRESKMGRLGKLNQWTKNKKLSTLATMAGGTAAGAGGGLLQNVLGEAGGKALYTEGAIAAGTVGKTIAKIAGSTGLKLVGLAGTAVIMAGMDAAKGWIYKHKEWKVRRGSAAAAAAIAGTGDRGIVSAFSNMGKWAAAGAAIGMLGGPPGMLAGGLIGAAIGGVLAWIGGLKISNWIDSIVSWLSGDIVEKTKKQVSLETNVDLNKPSEKTTFTPAPKDPKLRTTPAVSAEQIIKILRTETITPSNNNGSQIIAGSGNTTAVDASQNTFISTGIKTKDPNSPTISIERGK